MTQVDTLDVIISKDRIFISRVVSRVYSGHTLGILRYTQGIPPLMFFLSKNE